MGSVALIIVGDGDSLVTELLQQRFQRQGHQALVAHTSNEALNLAERFRPDLVVLNAVFPPLGVSEVYRRLKATPGLERTAVLVYSLHMQVTEELTGFAQDATLLNQRSSGLSELTMHTNSVLQRGHREQLPALSDRLVAGGLVLHADSVTVEEDGRIANLTPTEFELLRYLMLHVDEACSSRRLLQNVWGYPPGIGSPDLVRTHIRNLRHKIEGCPAQPVHLRTIRHRGYVLCSRNATENGEKHWVIREDRSQNTPPHYSSVLPSTVPTSGRSE